MMNGKTKNIFTFLVIIFAFFLKADFILALEIHYPTIFGHSLNDTSSFGDYMCYLFSLGMDLAFMVAILVIVFGGIYYLVSYGRGKFTSEGKEWVKAGIVGLLIVVCAALTTYTINPGLNACKIDFLPIINLLISTGGYSPGSGMNVSVYKEIPIGTLTENLLTRTMNCYGFDQEGDPIDGDSKTEDILEPTYMNHDRADCLTQLIDGSQKKAEVIATLSDEIMKLMNQCSCIDKETGASKCDDTCGGADGCDQPVTCPNEKTYECSGECAVNAGCEQPEDTNDCCPTDSGLKDDQGKIISVKDQIEHGPISVAVDVFASEDGEECQTETIEYNGLDEFRCPNPEDNKADDKLCTGRYIIDFIEEQIEIDDVQITVINEEKWGKLNLWQQLTYLQQKISDWSEDSKIQDDEDALYDAKVGLGNCYLAVPYTDLLKKYQTANQEKYAILTQKIFFDPYGNQIDISRYCKGFNYGNSSCLKKCNDMCPDSDTDVALQFYGECTDPDEEDGCIKNAYMSRQCLYSEDSQDFEGCMNSCQEDCSDDCEEKYLQCSKEYEFCQSQCEDNGQCALDNSDACLFDARQFQQCAEQVTDQGNADYCIDYAYLCRNGSDEYAGYSDCIEPSSAGCPDFGNRKTCEKSKECVWENGKCAYIKCSSLKNREKCEKSKGCIWKFEECSQDRSASFLYSNPGYQKCPDPYGSADEDSVCYSSSTDPICRELCPETTKCPADSKCPGCVCGQLEEDLEFSVPNESISDEEDGKVNTGDEGYSTTSEKISEYKMVSSQCNEYSYNDDPLTFYCQDAWWKDPNKEGSSSPEGANKKCDLEGEIPVGQVVDDALGWANKLMDVADKMVEKNIQPMLSLMTKIGNAKDDDIIKDYCKCNAKLEDKNPICKTGCQYNQDQIYIEENDSWKWVCGCTFTPCKGDPCKQIVDYLSELWNDYRKFKLDFIDLYTDMLKEPRSDIMKELTYSRQMTDSCSLINSAYGAEARLLSCTRARDELIPPINDGQIILDNETFENYCYGQDLGKLLDRPLMDNWFCCQEWSKDATINNQSIYNINE